MGKNKQQQKKQEELLKTLGDFTCKENWDQFFSIRGSDDAFEWYAEWPELKDVLLPHLSSPSPSSSNDDGGGSSSGGKAAEEVQILVPGCGNSKLSEYLYDTGYRNITNIDFSKVVILDMLKRNVRLRPEMKWRVMDMTKMQFEKETFDVVLDKGGLDALMEPELGPKLGNEYLSEVKRVLKDGGKFLCLTLAESHVLGLLFPKFRCGWRLRLHVIPPKSTAKPSLLTFMVIAEKDDSSSFSQISSSIDLPSFAKNGNQVRGLYEVLQSENEIRSKYSSGSDVTYLLEDLKIAPKVNLEELYPGRRLQLKLGDPGGSRFTYKAILLDAPQDSGPFSYHCGALLIPKSRAHEWLYSSEEGQWMVVESSKAARLVMILLDSSHSDVSMDEIQKDLSPLVKQLEPGDNRGAQIPFMAASDGIKQRKIVHKITSPLTGPIIVEDVIYEKNDDYISRLSPSKDVTFRRLTFERSEGIIQSEALLVRAGSQVTDDIGQKKTRLSSKPRKGNQRKSDLIIDLRVDHSYLASSYHSGIVSGLALIASYMGEIASKGETVKSVIVGLGAGLLPMFLHGCLPFLKIEVVELDSVVLDVARDYFGVTEDMRLKVHVTDGIKYVGDIASSEVSNVVTEDNGTKDAPVKEKVSASDGGSSLLPAGRENHSKIDLLVVDVDSADISSGLTCPAADFVEDSFLLTAKNTLSRQGLFVINLVSRSPAIKDMVFSRMKTVRVELMWIHITVN
ncbi:OLC1v1019094C3 [Oldenlandia corymbosa var. corymbosa]|uniref:OLC1v1019094C3 n=1 Tax=Oldenlandia corymbosa var. corymbosa TaxID=529605 RepID=A0AAV1EDJ3_OLDCO|nr:OLC1v1019094C3 [Oldenlandia corymbosa var. corymbosa]